MGSAELKILTRLADEGIEGLNSFIIKHIDNPSASKATKNVLGIIMDAFSTGETKLIRPPLPNTSPNALRNELTGFLDQRIAKTGPRGLLLNTSQLPASVRNIGLQAVPGLDYTTGKLIERTPSQAAITAMRDNVETLLDMGGNTQFYYDKNGILRRIAPDLDPMYSSMLSAPFSIGSNPVDELHRFGMFIEDPTRYVPSVGMAGGMPQGKALTLMTRDNPTIQDLSTSGDVMKIGSYAENSGDPFNSLRATIDTHAFKLPSGLPHSGDSSTLTPNQYKMFEKIYQDVAGSRGMLPHEVQSATWDVWRRMMQTDPGDMLSPQNYSEVPLNPIFGLDTASRTKAIRRMLEQNNPDMLRHLY
jgi:hypothetical protein